MAAVAEHVSVEQTPAITLEDLGLNRSGRIVALRPSEPADPDLLRRLAELGFLPGERVRIVARGVPGGTPIAVRVGTSTFALRRFEARCVLIAADTGS